MARANLYTVNPGWRILLLDAGINPTNVLRRAGLPEDLLGREKAYLSTQEYFRLWKGLEDETEDPRLPIHLGTYFSAESLNPPVFAALCSQDLNGALARLSVYKRLIGPMVLKVEQDDVETTLTLKWLDEKVVPPASLVAMELVFFVKLARMATRTELCPTKVISPINLEPEQAYVDFFGVGVRTGQDPRISFRAADATLPFLTANKKMWECFEPELRKNLSELDEMATTSDRVEAALLELLPGGAATIDSVAVKLGVSRRTLQRRLKQEGQTFQRLLKKTRSELAKHYLRSSKMSGAEISFLLGFEEPNSFFRAFFDWTGQTPEQARNALRQMR